MTTLIKEIANEDGFVRILTRALCNATTTFSDLWWSENDFEVGEKVPAFAFHSNTRMFVLGQVNGQLRYFAGDNDIYQESYDYEVGSFDGVKDAIAFAEKYLVEKNELRDIEISRGIRRARLEGKPGSIIQRPNWPVR